MVSLGIQHGCPQQALAIARGLAMVSYRSPQEFSKRFKGGIAGPDPLGPSEPGNYLAARGEAFLERMSPGRFLSLSASIDRQRTDVGRIRNTALLVGIAEDQLVPIENMRAMAHNWGGHCQLHTLRSIYGHDAFLKEAASLSGLIGKFLGEQS
jgi:homoserine O-acetyltransferase